MPSAGYTKIYRSTEYKWEDILGHVSLSQSMGVGEHLLNSWRLPVMTTLSSPQLFWQVLAVLCFQPLSKVSWANKLCWFSKPYLIGCVGCNIFFLPSNRQNLELRSALFKSHLPAQAEQKASVVSFAQSRLPNNISAVLGEVGVNPKQSHTLSSVPDQALGLRAFCFSTLSPRNLEKWDSSPVTPEVSNPNESFGITQQPGGKNAFLRAASGLGISRITLWSCSLPHLL